MKNNLYRGKTTGKLYFAQLSKYTKGFVRLQCLSAPYYTASVSISALKIHYELIVKE